MERAHRTILDRLYKYFTYKNTYRYIDVLHYFVTGYNDTVHNATGLALARVSDKDILAIWQRMREKASRVRPVRAKYGMGQLVGIRRKRNLPRAPSRITVRRYYVSLKSFTGVLGQSTNWKTRINN